MRTPSSHYLLRLLAFVLALLLNPHAARAQTIETSGSTIESSGSTIESSGSTIEASGSTIEASGSTGGTTSYDAPNVYNLGGGTVSLATAILNGGTVTNGTINASTALTGYSGSVTASLTGTAELTKSTTGTLTLAGTNTYTGTTSVTGGTLLVTGSLGSTAATVFNDATLGGTGTIGGATTISAGGILTPGDAVGTLTFAQGLTLNAGAVINFDLGTVSDLIRVSGGTLSGPASGQVTFNFTDTGGFGQATYTLFDFTGASRLNFDLTDFAIGTAPVGWNYQFAFSDDTLRLNLTAAAVPEPASVALGAGVLALTAHLVRRRRLVRPRE
jgi:autotransporter-associated beta strand protein